MIALRTHHDTAATQAHSNPSYDSEVAVQSQLDHDAVAVHEDLTVTQLRLHHSVTVPRSHCDSITTVLWPYCDSTTTTLRLYYDCPATLLSVSWIFTLSNDTDKRQFREFHFTLKSTLLFFYPSVINWRIKKELYRLSPFKMRRCT